MEPVDDDLAHAALLELNACLDKIVRFRAAGKNAHASGYDDLAFVINLMAMTMETYATVLRKYAGL